MKIRPFQAIYPRLEFISSSDSFFGTVKEDYPEFKSSGFFHKAAQEGIYLYEIQTAQRSYFGVIATSDIQDYKDGKILKHENTLPTSEQKQLQLFFKRKATVKPVLLTYPDVKTVDKWIANYAKNNKPFLEIEFEIDQKKHRFWEICEGSKISELQKLFDKHISKAYISDGHHRTSTSEIIYDKTKKKEGERYRHFLTAYFSFSNLEIYDFNRITVGLNDNEPEIFMAKLSKHFSIKVGKKPLTPKSKFEIVMYFKKNWYRLKWKKKVINQYKDAPAALDANILNDKVLAEILGIENVRTDKRIKYVEGLKGMDFFTKMVNEKPDSVGFLLYPVQWEDFLAIADAKSIMPPKSTWFEPRMKNGLLVHEP